MWLSKKIKQLYDKIVHPHRRLVLETPNLNAIPLYIKRLAKNYPIIHTVAGNQSIGKIVKFNFVSGTDYASGQYVSQTEHEGKTEFDCLYVHIKDNYFKQVLKTWTY